MMKQRRNKKSHCEKSVKKVISIVSSLSLAKISTRNPPPFINIESPIDSDTEIAITQIPGHLKLQEQENISKPSSYLIDPNEGKGSLYLIREGMNIDKQASSFIRRFYENNRSD
ncbi:hypothetical protein GIB67_011011 [Kingdonia uniflora]|uniref:Uncharacterized protein n=1 Tax=Kingdonia uniflora TaxID=39325 RepID=A0A7J7L6B3_9MAGN|nr:hypothetical protein GIB67_011011 [Kingdonia uniflora]